MENIFAKIEANAAAPEASEQPRPSIAETIATTIQRVDQDPFGTLAQSVGDIAGRLGVSPAWSNRLARDVYAGIQSLGPLGAELPFMAASPRVPGPRVAAPAPGVAPGASPSVARESLQARVNAIAPQAENIFAKIEADIQGGLTTNPPAPRVGDKPTLAPAEDFAGNINLNRIQTTDDVKNIIRETSKEFGGFEEARRGVITHEQTRELAAVVGMTPDKLVSRGLGKTFNAEEMFAARRLVVGQAEEVRRLAKAAYGGSDADKVKALEAITRLSAMQEQIAGATAEAGRLLSQQRMMAEASRDVANLKRIIDSAGGRTEEIFEGISRLHNAPPEAVAQFVRGATKAKTSDMVQEAWINALLSGPVTHATNMLSNSLVAAWQVPEALATATVSKLTGSGVTYSEAATRAFGLVEGAKDGLRAGYRAFLTEEPSDFATKIEQSRYQSIPSKTFRAGKERKEIGGVPIPLTGEIKVGGRQVRIPGRALTASDEFFKAINYRAEINALALRQARSEGKRGGELAKRVAELKATPTEEMLASARTAAEKQTFTNPLGKDAKAVSEWTNRHLVAKAIAPFVRTPVNIVKFAAERSPLAPLFKEVRENLKGANGAVARDGQIARIALGSTVGAIAASYAADGTITGGGPADPKKRAALYATGWQPYSVKIGGTYYAFGRLEPLGMFAGVAADLVELNKHMNADERDSIAALIMGSISKNLVSKTWLRGPAELIEAVQDPDRYGERYIQNLTGTLVPTGVAQIARTRDPYLREARSILDKIKERTPGYRETLPVRRDTFGEPIKLDGALGPDILSPIYTSPDAKDPIANELVRLGIAPSRVMRKIRDVDLEASEYDTFQKQAGQLAKRALATVMAAPGYQGLTDEAKREVLEDAMRRARDIGRDLTLKEFPAIGVRARAAKEKKAGLLTEGTP